MSPRNLNKQLLMNLTGTYKSIQEDKTCHRRDGLLPADLGVRDPVELRSVLDAVGSAVGDNTSSVVTVRGGSTDARAFVQVRPAREDGWAVLSHVSLEQSQLLPDVKVLRDLWDLTPTEALVAIGLLVHEDLADMAAARKISIETVRMHVKSLLRKTGMPNQKKLVGLLTRLAALTVTKTKTEPEVGQ